MRDDFLPIVARNPKYSDEKHLQLRRNVKAAMKGDPRHSYLKVDIPNTKKHAIFSPEKFLCCGSQYWSPIQVESMYDTRRTLSLRSQEWIINPTDCPLCYPELHLDVFKKESLILLVKAIAEAGYSEEILLALDRSLTEGK